MVSHYLRSHTGVFGDFDLLIAIHGRLQMGLSEDVDTGFVVTGCSDRPKILNHTFRNSEPFSHIPFVGYIEVIFTIDNT
ncbi:hypothetical protein Poly41_57500 [Novipirellula artificiosorum]|uniref:Uncharacterized protein n=1 Tax=Novipirellula artificiosorum TaxID=2528016 RepID=A0A5C6D847_9BACT|nr:hypothetical protein Poly41_57500 [Novipirellula artificiosorum]